MSPTRTFTAARIAALNDTFRSEAMALAPLTVPGRVILTRGVAALPIETQLAILRAIGAFHTFTLSNDPHQEHDFGQVEVEDYRLFWKIDYYAEDPLHGAEEGSESPDDPTRSFRVLTIMLTEEY